MLLSIVVHIKIIQGHLFKFPCCFVICKCYTAYIIFTGPDTLYFKCLFDRRHVWTHASDKSLLQIYIMYLVSIPVTYPELFLTSISSHFYAHENLTENKSTNMLVQCAACVVRFRWSPSRSFGSPLLENDIVMWKSPRCTYPQKYKSRIFITQAGYCGTYYRIICKQITLT